MAPPDALDSPLVRRTATIVNRKGLHARAAAKLVKLASGFQSEVRVVKNGSVVNGRSIMGLMMLAAATGTTIEIRAQGPDAEAAADAVASLVVAGFDED
jgi:phosphocarrier protein